MEDLGSCRCSAEATRKPIIQPTRRFSSEHIRRQPEYQFMKSGLSEQLIQTSIDVCAYANRVKTSPIPEDKGTPGYPCTVARSHGRNAGASTVSRPTTTGTIKIVQKVDKIYSTITVITRPKTSVGFCSAPRPEQDRNVSVCQTTRTPSGVGRQPSGGGQQKCFYDPALEKSKTYLHKKNDMFTGANQDLTPTRPGLTKLQLHYTDINATHNDGVIFAHLLQSAHKKNALIGDGVYGLERRLYTKRSDSAKWTTFWDRHDVVRPGSKGKPARTVAQKKKERKKKITEKNDKMKMVFVPRARTLTTPTTADMEELRHTCRHLRIHPKFQEHLYNTGLVFYSQNDKQVEPEA